MSGIFPVNTIGPISRDGRELWLSYRIPLAPGDRIHVLFERVQPPLRHGLILALTNRRQRLRINGHESARFSLWADTAPRHTEVEYMPPRSAGELILMNQWNIPDYGPTNFQGLGNACMAVSAIRSTEWLVECNHGYGSGSLTYDHLVVRIVKEPSRVPPRRPAA
jgi:hypothetical protein